MGGTAIMTQTLTILASVVVIAVVSFIKEEEK